MPLAEIFTLTTLGTSLIGWGVGKVCDKTVLSSHAQMQRRLKQSGLDPNHDIEAAILTAHYKALKFIVEDTFAQKHDKRVQANSARLKHMRGQQGFRRIFKEIETRDFAGLLPAMAENWQTVIPANFETVDTLTDMHQTIPTPYAAQAKADLLSLATWTSVETEALSERVIHPDLGWAPSFSACLREQIKINDPFRHIYMAQLQEHQLAYLDDISSRLAEFLTPDTVLTTAMKRVEAQLGKIEIGVEEANARLERIEAKVDMVVAKGHYANEVGHQYPRYLAKLLLKTDTSEADWEAEITAALTRYVEGKAQLEKQTQLPHHLDAKRAEALALYEQAKLDEGEAILQELIETVTRERLETAARDHAHILIDQVPFATAKLDFNRAMDLYEQAAQAVLVTDKRQAIGWYRGGASLGYDRGSLFGDGFMKRSEAFCQAALSHTQSHNRLPLSEYKADWAMTQNNLGTVYQVLGRRGEDGALDKAVLAYESALTVLTKKAAPLKWAMIQNNLGNVYQVLGERGEDGALDKAVLTYESALTVRTKKAAPMKWAMTAENMGYVLWAQDKKEVAEACFRGALTVFRAQDANWYVNKLENAMRSRGLDI